MSAKAFIQSFLSRKGAHVLFSFFFSKVSNFLVAVAIIRMLPKSEYGSIVYAASILSFLMPFMGAGIHQGLIRYGALSGGQLQKKYLLQQTLWRGLQASALLVVLMLLSVPFVTQNMPEAALFFGVLSFQLLTLMLFQFVVIYCRILRLNRLFAKMENVNNILLVIGNIAMCYFFQGIGYVVSLVVIPFLVGLYYMYRLKLFQRQAPIGKDKPNILKYINYGLSMSIGSVMAQMLYAVDILLLGNMLSDSEELVAQYKASTIFPFSLLFIPVAVIASDFVKLARAAETDKPYLKSYYLNYLKIFSGVSLLIFLFFFFFGKNLLAIFGKDYEQVPELMVIFAVGVVGGLLFRVPLGNILSAIGWPKVNMLFSAVILLLNVVGSYYMIQTRGLIGAALVTSALMWLSGLLSLVAFWWFVSGKR